MSIDLENSIKKHIKGSQPAPVHLWNPPFCGNLDIRVNIKGQWFYQGSEIRRERLIKLFSNILKREGKKYFLVTPVEKVGIQVDGVPFIANEMWATGKNKERIIKFRTNVGDEIILDNLRKFNISFRGIDLEPVPYVKVRANLYAKIDRKSFYRLIELCADQIYLKKSWFGFWSANIFFPIAETEETKA